MGKEEVKTIFTDEMLLYVEKPKESRRKLLELINKQSCRVQDKHKKVSCFYTSAMNNQKRKLRKQFHLQ